jgi:hypothetical protein
MAFHGSTRYNWIRQTKMCLFPTDAHFSQTLTFSAKILDWKMCILVKPTKIYIYVFIQPLLEKLFLFLI